MTHELNTNLGEKCINQKHKSKLLKEQEKTFEWMFKVQEERLKQRGYPCNSDGTRSPIIDLSENKGKKIKLFSKPKTYLKGVWVLMQK